MRADQYERLKDLSEKLTDTVIAEADPTKWTGYGVEVSKLTREDRGDAYWCKKNAAATLSVLMRVHNLVGVIERAAPGAPLEVADEGETDLDQEVRAAEKEAKRLLNGIAKRSRARARTN